MFPHEVSGLKSGEIRELFGDVIADILKVDNYSFSNTLSSGEYRIVESNVILTGDTVVKPNDNTIYYYKGNGAISFLFENMEDLNNLKK